MKSSLLFVFAIASVSSVQAQNTQVCEICIGACNSIMNNEDCIISCNTNLGCSGTALTGTSTTRSETSSSTVTTGETSVVTTTLTSPMSNSTVSTGTGTTTVIPTTTATSTNMRSGNTTTTTMKKPVQTSPPMSNGNKMAFAAGSVLLGALGFTFMLV